LLAFVTLAFSSNPVLHAIGLTVGVGAAMAFLTSAALARR
jgi:predicted exporter